MVNIAEQASLGLSHQKEHAPQQSSVWRIIRKRRDDENLPTTAEAYFFQSNVSVSPEEIYAIRALERPIAENAATGLKTLC
jgi:hypothetical protein